MTRLDPSRTTTLRRQMIRDMRRRFLLLKKAVIDAIVTQDVFGLEEASPFEPLINVERQAWRFRTNPQKVDSFRKWLQGEIDNNILSVDVAGDPWTAKYVDSAYRKGTVRAFVDARGASLEKGAGFFDGSKAEYLRQAFAQPERLSKIKLLATRSFEELRGVTNAASQQMNRILASGLAEGRGPREIARAMTRRIDVLTKTRAEVIARTEIIAAHAEGQLDSFQDLGIEELGLKSEWSTAGDDRVCAICANLEGQLFTVDEARGLLPAHPNCRCAWIPSSQSLKDKIRAGRAKKVSGGPKPVGGGFTPLPLGQRRPPGWPANIPWVPPPLKTGTIGVIKKTIRTVTKKTSKKKTSKKKTSKKKTSKKKTSKKPPIPTTAPTSPGWSPVTNVTQGEHQLAQFLSPSVEGEPILAVFTHPLKMRPKPAAHMTKVINAIGEDLAHMRNNFSQFPKLLKSGPVGELRLDTIRHIKGYPGAVGEYIPSTKDLTVATKSSKELHAIPRTGFFDVDASVSATFRHELGHAIHENAITHLQRQAWTKLHRSRPSTWWKKEVSSYGATDKFEAFAEAFAHYTSPRRTRLLHPEIERFMDSIMKGI